VPALFGEITEDRLGRNTMIGILCLRTFLRARQGWFLWAANVAASHFGSQVRRQT
jgi:hypothetical protein